MSKSNHITEAICPHLSTSKVVTDRRGRTLYVEAAKARLYTCFYLCLSICLGALFGASHTWASEPLAPKSASTILVVGDSISAGYGIQREQGWVSLFSKDLVTAELPWRVTNASVSGETTGGGLARLPDLLATHTPQLVLIELGGNDGLRGYPVKKIRSNLLEMIRLVQAQDAVPVIMAMRIPPNYGPRYTGQFDQVFAEVAEQTASQLIPFFLNDIALEDGMMQNDGIHPTAVAQPIMANTVKEALLNTLANE